MVVHQDGNTPIAKEVSTSVEQVFTNAGIPGLTGAKEIHQALDGLHNILAELGGLH